MPFKVKIFLWLLMRNIILTEDNLLKRVWTRNDQCYFCGQPKSIKHLLFDCGLSMFAWRLILHAFDLARPLEDIHHLIHGWLDQSPSSIHKLAIIGGTALCWTTWKTRNVACFEKKISDDFASVFLVCVFANFSPTGKSCRQTKRQKALRLEWRQSRRW